MIQLTREYMMQRTLVWVLTRRTLITRYRGTALGFLWTFLHPLMLFVVYAVVFGQIMRVEMPGDQSYSAFLIAGLLPWTWFSQSLTISSTSILADATWIRQGSFSPAIPPLVVNVASLVNFLLGVPILLLVLAALGTPLGASLLWLPLVIAVQIPLLLGLSLALAALTVRYRDIAQLLQALIPIWFFVTPIIYPVSVVPDRFRWVIELNPVTHLAMAYQAVLTNQQSPDPKGLLIALACGVAMLAIGGAILKSLRDRIPEEL